MSEEEKQAIEYLKHSIFEYEEIDTSVMEYMDKNHKIIYKLILKQQKEIEEYRKLRADIIKVNKKIYDVDIIEDMCEQLANSISKDKVLAVFKKYGLDEKECFFSSTSDIIKFVEDMRKLMGIGE